jgi:diacylglycerol kinase family enzyme
MVLLAAIGFEAELVRAADRETKQRLGPLAYLFGGVAQFARQESFALRLEAGGEVLETEAVAVTVANAAPPTSVLAHGLGGPLPDDGLLDVTVVTADNKLEALTAFAKLVQAGLAESEAEAESVRSFRATSVRVTTDPPQSVAVDGELLETTPAEFECLPRALRVCSE